MSEWLKEHAWKACVGETLPWVRIPLSPPTSLATARSLSVRVVFRRGAARCACPRPGTNPSPIAPHFAPARREREHDQRTGGEVGGTEVVRRRRVRGQDPATGRVREDGDDLAIPRPQSIDAALPRGERDGRQRPEIRLTRALKVALVIKFLYPSRRWESRWRSRG
jgi:hypothetical protein